MSEGHPSERGEFPDRRTADRQISVLINAGITHEGRDTLCRIRNLSPGGVMIECTLPLAVDDKILLHLRSGHDAEGLVRWVRDGKAGIAFDDPAASALVSGAVGGTGASFSPIGYPLFRRDAWVGLSAGHRKERAAVAMISPTGILVETGRDWGRECLFTVTFDGLGDHLARTEGGIPDDDMMALIFVRPLHYRLFDEWLTGTRSDDAPPPAMVRQSEGLHWT